MNASEGLNAGEAENETGFKVHPNPTNGIINLSLEGPAARGKYAIHITDLQGKLLMKEVWIITDAMAPKKIDTGHFQSGMYLLNLRAARQNQTVKFMKF